MDKTQQMNEELEILIQEAQLTLDSFYSSQNIWELNCIGNDNTSNISTNRIETQLFNISDQLLKYCCGNLPLNSSELGIDDSFIGIANIIKDISAIIPNVVEILLLYLPRIQIIKPFLDILPHLLTTSSESIIDKTSEQLQIVLDSKKELLIPILSVISNLNSTIKSSKILINMSLSSLAKADKNDLPFLLRIILKGLRDNTDSQSNIKVLELIRFDMIDKSQPVMSVILESLIEILPTSYYLSQLLLQIIKSSTHLQYDNITIFDMTVVLVIFSSNSLLYVKTIDLFVYWIKNTIFPFHLIDLFIAYRKENEVWDKLTNGLWKLNIWLIDFYSMNNYDNLVDISLKISHDLIYQHVIHLNKQLFNNILYIQESMIKHYLSMIFHSKLSITEFLEEKHLIATKKNQIKTLKISLLSLNILKELVFYRHDITKLMLTIITNRLQPDSKGCVYLPEFLILNKLIEVVCYSVVNHHTELENTLLIIINKLISTINDSNFKLLDIIKRNNRMNSQHISNYNISKVSSIYNDNQYKYTQKSIGYLFIYHYLIFKYQTTNNILASYFLSVENSLLLINDQSIYYFMNIFSNFVLFFNYNQNNVNIVSNNVSSKSVTSSSNCSVDSLNNIILKIIEYLSNNYTIIERITDCNINKYNFKTGESFYTIPSREYFSDCTTYIWDVVRMSKCISSSIDNEINGHIVDLLWLYYNLSIIIYQVNTNTSYIKYFSDLEFASSNWILPIDIYLANSSKIDMIYCENISFDVNVYIRRSFEYAQLCSILLGRINAIKSNYINQINDFSEDLEVFMICLYNCRAYIKLGKQLVLTNLKTNHNKKSKIKRIKIVGGCNDNKVDETIHGNDSNVELESQYNIEDKNNLLKFNHIGDFITRLINLIDCEDIIIYLNHVTNIHSNLRLITMELLPVTLRNKLSTTYQNKILNDKSRFNINHDNISLIEIYNYQSNQSLTRSIDKVINIIDNLIELFDTLANLRKSLNNDTSVIVNSSKNDKNITTLNINSYFYYIYYIYLCIYLIISSKINTNTSTITINNAVIAVDYETTDEIFSKLSRNEMLSVESINNFIDLYNSIESNVMKSCNINLTIAGMNIILLLSKYYNISNRCKCLSWKLIQSIFNEHIDYYNCNIMISDITIQFLSMKQVISKLISNKFKYINIDIIKSYRSYLLNSFDSKIAIDNLFIYWLYYESNDRSIIHGICNYIYKYHEQLIDKRKKLTDKKSKKLKSKSNSITSSCTYYDSIYFKCLSLLTYLILLCDPNRDINDRTINPFDRYNQINKTMIYIIKFIIKNFNIIQNENINLVHYIRLLYNVMKHYLVMLLYTIQRCIDYRNTYEHSQLVNTIDYGGIDYIFDVIKLAYITMLTINQWINYVINNINASNKLSSKHQYIIFKLYQSLLTTYNKHLNKLLDICNGYKLTKQQLDSYYNNSCNSYDNLSSSFIDQCQQYDHYNIKVLESLITIEECNSKLDIPMSSNEINNNDNRMSYDQDSSSESSEVNYEDDHIFTAIPSTSNISSAGWGLYNDDESLF